MTTILAFDGLSGTGKSAVSRAVCEGLPPSFSRQWVHHSSAFGMNLIRQLLFSRQAEFGIDRVSYQHLRNIFFRQYFSHLIKPHLGVVDVLVLDNPCFGEIDFDSTFVGDGFTFHVDLIVVTWCDYAIVPARVANREAGSYQVDAAEYVAGGAAEQAMAHMRCNAESHPDVLGIDTTHMSVAQAANIVLAECERRFGWDVASLR